MVPAPHQTAQEPSHGVWSGFWGLRGTQTKAEPATPAKKPGFSTVSLQLSFCPLLSALHSYVPKQQQGEEMSVCLWLHRTLHSRLRMWPSIKKKKSSFHLQNFSMITQKKPLQTPKVCLELRGNESADLTHTGNIYPSSQACYTQMSPDTQYVQLVVPKPTFLAWPPASTPH